MGSSPFLGTTSPSRIRRATRHLPRWRNWYTRTFEGRMRQLIRVQVPAWAPTSNGRDRRIPAVVLRPASSYPRRILAAGRLAQLVRAPRLHRGSRGFESLTAHQAPRVVSVAGRGSSPPGRRTWPDARRASVSGVTSSSEGLGRSSDPSAGAGPRSDGARRARLGGSNQGPISAKDHGACIWPDSACLHPGGRWGRWSPDGHGTTAC